MKIAFLLLLTVLSMTGTASGRHALVTAHQDGPRPQAKEDRVKTNSFTVTRDLVEYSSLGFFQDLEKLNGKSHWIDMGSGEGVAIEQYVQSEKSNALERLEKGVTRDTLAKILARPLAERARVTGITYHMHRSGDRNYENRLRHMTGRYFEDIPEKEIGRADLITDVQGVLFYTRRLDETLARYLSLLKSNGVLYVARANLIRTELQIGNRRTNLLDYLIETRIPGIRVEDSASGLRITKTGDPIRIPRLELATYDDRFAPPHRSFRVLAEEQELPRVTDTHNANVDFTVDHRRRPATPARPLSSSIINGLNRALGYEAIRPGEP